MVGVPCTKLDATVVGSVVARARSSTAALTVEPTTERQVDPRPDTAGESLLVSGS